MSSYRIYVPFSEQTKNYFFASRTFLESVGYGEESLLFLSQNALSLFQEYLDFLIEESLVLAHSPITNSAEDTFNMKEVSEELCKETVMSILLPVETQGIYDLIENVREKSLAQNQAEAIVYAISYFAFLVGIVKQGGDVLLGLKTDNGFVLRFYDIELFRLYHSGLTLPN